MAQTPFDLVLAPEHDGVGLVLAAQQVFGEVQPGLREPAGTRHAAGVVDRHAARIGADHPAKIPDLAPEGARLLDRPPPKRRHAIEAKAVAAIDAVDESSDPRLIDALGRGLPKHVGHGVLPSL